MPISALFGWLRRDASPTRVPLDFLHSRERFRDILEVERMRADRTGLPFALVVFTLPESGGEESVDEPTDPELTRVRFARHLERRRRATDHIGEMHDRHLGVVLWNATEEGAWTFGREVARQWEGEDKPECEVFLYPTYIPPARRSRGDDEPRRTNPVEADLPSEPLSVGDYDSKPLEMLFVRPLPFWKRAVDIVVSAMGLLALTPLFLVVAALVKLTSRGPVLFAQQRTGHGGRPFTIYKFRTMCVDAEARKDALREFSEQDGPAFKLARDPRITSIGRFLRKTCIDELPQLWNVLVGDMTLVGPRPLEVTEADQTTGWERRRLDITPGLTCIWQVEGKSKVTFAEWMRMDIRYTRVRSAWQDLKLVLRTIAAMLRLKASQ